MELLILAALEIAIPLGLAALSLAFNGLAALGALVALIFSAPFKSGAVSPGRNPGEAITTDLAPPKESKWRSRISRVLAGLSSLLLLLLSLALLADLFFFEALTRRALGHLQGRIGLTADFAKVEGSFFRGRFHFQDLAASRSQHPVADFEIKIAEADLDIDMSELLRRNIVFEKMEARGLEGFWEQKARSEKKGPGGPKLKPRRPFRIDNFSLLDLNLSYHRQDPGGDSRAELHLDYLQSKALSSQWLVPGLLFGSQAAGSLNGLPFSVLNEHLPGRERENVWLCEDLPVEALASLAGGPFNWFEKGRVGVSVRNHRRLDEKARMEMDWRIDLRDFQTSVPAGASAATRLWATPLVMYLNSKSEGLELAFHLELDPEDLRLSSSADLLELIKISLGETIQKKIMELEAKARSGGREANRDAAAPEPSEPRSDSLEDSRNEGGRKFRSLFRRKSVPQEAATPE